MPLLSATCGGFVALRISSCRPDTSCGIGCAQKGKQSGKRAVPIPVKTVGPSQLEASDVDHIEVADDADKAQVVDRGAGEEGGKASAQGNSHPAAPARAEDGDARALREENDRLRAEVASK